MKKTILSALTLTLGLGISLAQNQDYTITDLEMVEYENNSIHVYNVHGTFADPVEEAKLHLVVNNFGNEDIKVAAETVEFTNTDGSLAQFCIGGPAGNCFNPIFEGSFYPNANGGILAAGSNWGMFDYFINLDPTNLAEYKLRFVQMDDSGNEIPDTNFFITYKYDENAMAVSDVESSAIAQIYPTVASGYTNVSLKENASVQIMNLEGKSVKSLRLNSGESKLDLSGLPSGIYWVQFKGVSGLTTTSKIVIK